MSSLPFWLVQTEPRTKVVDLKNPQLVKFSQLDSSNWEVKGLTFLEIAKIDQEVKQAEDRERLGEALATYVQNMQGSSLSTVLKAVEEVREQDYPETFTRAVWTLVFGSVSPKIMLQDAVKFSENFPLEFKTLVNEIQVLTGLGRVKKK
jgi:hypothetical protein